MARALHTAVAIGALAAVAPATATSRPMRATTPAAPRCTVADPRTRATIEIQMANAPDFCEVVSQALAGDVFHAPLLVTPGRVWHYPGTTVTCRLHFRRRSRLTVRNSAEICSWLDEHATNWTRAAGH